MSSTVSGAHAPVAESSAPTPWRRIVGWLAAAAFLPILAILIWQGVTAHGSPDPTVPRTSHVAAILDIAVLVFREGLESILVIAAITAGLARKDENRGHTGPIFLGASLGFVATMATWFAVRGIVSDLTASIPMLALQAATGLLAVLVLLVVMNWFFHKVYWGGWISLHNRRKKQLLHANETNDSPGVLFWGLVLLGLSSVYREGFEIVLFLQSYYLKLGHATVLEGSLLGLALTFVMAALTFWAHRRLPYRKMLIATGVLLGVVLLVMVGEEAFEMQQAQWIPTTTIQPLTNLVPDWAGVWFSVYPTVETIVAQIIAAALVVGSYFLSGKFIATHPAEVPAE